MSSPTTSLKGLAAGAAALLCVALWPAGAAADGGGGGGAPVSESSTPEYGQAVLLIRSERWSEAIALLQQHLRGASDDADGHNWLAFAYRKSGRLEPAFVHYRRALSLVPAHRGAHEYIGEAYLAAGEPDKAEHHLRELARICAASCEEYDDLKSAIAAYRAAPRRP